MEATQRQHGHQTVGQKSCISERTRTSPGPLREVLDQRGPGPLWTRTSLKQDLSGPGPLWMEMQLLQQQEIIDDMKHKTNPHEDAVMSHMIKTSNQVKSEQQFEPLWTRTSLDQNVSGPGPLWTRPPLDQDLSGPERLWTRTSLDQDLSGPEHLWTRTSLDQNVSGPGPFWTRRPLDQDLSERTRTSLDQD